jgi:KDO2-lipid IV(A) lauroyltransferase
MKLSKNLKYRLEFFALRGVIALLRLLPLDLAASFSGLLWHQFAPLLKRHQRADLHLSRMMPELSAAERQRTLRAMWRNLGRTFAESLMLDRILADPARITIDEASKAALLHCKREGGIIASPHLGNWEILAIPLTILEANHSGVYRRLNNPQSEAYLMSVRKQFYPAGLFDKGNGAARHLLRQARAGNSVGIMADLWDDGACMVPFFGRLAASTTMPAVLARQFHRPLYAASVIRNGRSRFFMQITEVNVEHTDDRKADIKKMTARVQAIFEGWIRTSPEQWMWAHKRFR